MKIEYQSLHKISKYFEIFLGIQISHQTIKKWSNNYRLKKQKMMNYILYFLHNYKYLLKKHDEYRPSNFKKKTASMSKLNPVKKNKRKISKTNYLFF